MNDIIINSDGDSEVITTIITTLPEIVSFVETSSDTQNTIIVPGAPTQIVTEAPEVVIVTEIPPSVKDTIIIQGPKGDTGPPGNAEDLWFAFVSTWTEEPAQIATIAEGAIFMYIHQGIACYRLVPTPYVASNDAFYTEWDGTTLSGQIATRG